MSTDGALGPGHEALAAGRWAEARSELEASLADEERADTLFALAAALWWQGENQGAVDRCTRAYALFRQADDLEGAVQCAVWLAITYKANFANFPAANGWVGRAERLLEPLEPGPLHGWAWVARSYRLADLEEAVALSERAVEVARAAGDVDLELVALSQLGLSRVGRGEHEAGFALIDEAIAGALAGEGSSLDTVVYACCDMLNACELTSDMERAAQWCSVADDFVDRYGCPFLYAECRIYYGSVLAAKGRWRDAEGELGAGLRITEGTCPGLHARAMVRLAGLRVRQGRLEEAEALLAACGGDIDAQREAALSLGALLLARGQAHDAGRQLNLRLRLFEQHQSQLAVALDLLVDAFLAAGDPAAADRAARRLDAISAATDSEAMRAAASGARGRVARSRDDLGGALEALERSLALWSTLEMPYEAARTRLELAGVLAGSAGELAIDHGRRALTAFEELGAAQDADRAAALLRSLGVVPRVGPKGVGDLTAREEEVLRLVVEGLSNPEIAARLHVSRKTASHHVSSILAKLGVRNRTEAAASARGHLAERPSERPDAK